MRYRGDTINDREQIGWQLVPLFRPPNDWDVKAAPIECCICGTSICDKGGPRIGAYCFQCAPENEHAENQNDPVSD